MIYNVGISILKNKFCNKLECMIADRVINLIAKYKFVYTIESKLYFVKTIKYLVIAFLGYTISKF